MGIVKARSVKNLSPWAQYIRGKNIAVYWYSDNQCDVEGILTTRQRTYLEKLLRADEPEAQIKFL